MIKKYNISKPEKYTSQGKEKTFWQNIGTMTEFYREDGSVSRIVEIPAISLRANIFPIEPRQETRAPARSKQQVFEDSLEAPEPEITLDEEEIKPEDLPF